MLAIAICATRNYTYAMHAQARRVAACCAHIPFEEIAVILVGDESKELKAVADLYVELFPGARIYRRALKGLDDTGANYKTGAQMLIARLRTEAHAAARALRADQCWSLDSDVLPPANALRCMQDMLRFDDGYYSISTCPYPNTAFLGGFGSRYHPINEDFKPHERKLPQELKDEFVANELELKKLRADGKEPDAATQERWMATNKRIRECPPDGTIWEVIAKYGWRRRGWLDNAYPGIGLGAVVPVDWCGFGCTLMNREALALATFDGYDGQGTEDLFVCWHRWHPAGLRINAIPHCPCDHVIWDKKKGGDAAKFTHHIAHHEPDGEYRGHLRVKQVPWTG
jgi:hypothetical protein